MQNEMNKTCAVCNKGKGPTKCEICGFSDGGFINRSFPNYEDLNNWIYAVVRPYRLKWEERRESEVLAKLGEIKYSSFIDPRDGKVYKTVKIGDQTWMAENLNYKISILARIMAIISISRKSNGKYGMLYDWQTAMKVSPPGWHLPTKEEWDVLIQALGGKDIAGKHLKAKSGWKDYKIELDDCKIKKSGNGEDTCGFAALPGGNNEYSETPLNSHKGYKGYEGYWWSASQSDRYGKWLSSRGAYNQFMENSNEGVSTGNSGKGCLFSVRCVQSTSSYIPPPSPKKLSSADIVLYSILISIIVIIFVIVFMSKYNNYSHQMHFDRGNAHFNNLNYDEAIKNYTAAIKIKPDNSDYLENRATAHLGKSDYNLAIADFEAVLRINPNRVNAKQNIKYIQGIQSNIDSENVARSKKEIAQVINFSVPVLWNIHKKYLKQKPGFGGNVTLKFTIAPNGDIISIDIVSSTTGYAKFDNEIKNTVATWKWKAIKGENVTYTWGFNF